MSIDWEMSVWEAWAMVFATVFTALFIWYLCTPPVLQGYYLGHKSENHAPSFCVMAEWRWDLDDVVYCTDDYNKALDFVERANKTMRRP